MYKRIIDVIEKAINKDFARALDSTCYFGHRQHYSNHCESRSILVGNFHTRQKSVRHRQPRYLAQ